MIAEIFRKSKPINLVIVSGLLLIGFLLSFFKSDVVLDSTFFLKNILVFTTALFSVFLVDFIVKKNRLTEQNSYAVFCYVLLILLFHHVFEQTNILISQFFILLALRRCISLKSKIDVKKKIFDASLWVFVAAFFNPWAILFIIIVIIAIVFYALEDYKNYLIPLVSFFIINLIVQSLHLFFYDTFFDFKLTAPVLPNITSEFQIFLICTVGLLCLWSLIVFFAVLNKKKAVLKRSFTLVFLIFLVAIGLNLLSEGQGVFLFFPLCIFMGNLFQEIKTRQIVEIITVLLFVLIGLQYWLS